MRSERHFRDMSYRNTPLFLYSELLHIWLFRWL